MSVNVSASALTGAEAEIAGASLVDVRIAADGTRFRIGFKDVKGRDAAINLPSECLHQLVMTMPRIAAEALRARHGDSSLRLVYPLGTWRIECAAGTSRLILTLATSDGFQVAFGVERDDITRMMQAVDGDSIASALARARN